MINHYDGGAPQPPKLYSVDQVCELLHMSRSTWRAFAKANRVPQAFVSSPRRQLYSELVVNQLIDGTYTPKSAAAAAAGRSLPTRRRRSQAVA